MFDEWVKKEHKTLQTAADKRCFIASCVYGLEAPQTERLRQWRDDSLAHKFGGSLFINTYYRLVTSIARVLGKHEGLKTVVRGMLDCLLRRL